MKVYIIIDTCPDNGGQISGVYFDKEKAEYQARLYGECYQVYEFEVQ